MCSLFGGRRLIYSCWATSRSASTLHVHKRQLTHPVITSTPCPQFLDRTCLGNQLNKIIGDSMFLLRTRTRTITTLMQHTDLQLKVLKEIAQ